MYNIILILIFIPILGAIKNVIKRKTFNLKIFLRTFVVYGIIYFFSKILKIYNFQLNTHDSMLLSLSERWGMFVYKILYSSITKNYEKKKFKYYEKYRLELSNNSLNKLDKLEKNN
jgi:hypothetical protein